MWKLEIKFGSQNSEELFLKTKFFLKIKFENREFQKLFENGNLKIKSKKREFWRIIWKWKFEN